MFSLFRLFSFFLLRCNFVTRVDCHAHADQRAASEILVSEYSGREYRCSGGTPHKNIQISVTLIRIFLHKPPADPSGKASVDMHKEQVLFLALNDYSVTVAGDCAIKCAGRAEVPHSFDGKTPAMQVGL